MEVRLQFDLTIDERERDELESILSGCATTEMIVQERPSDPQKTPVGDDEEVGNALEIYDDNGDGRITCAEARNHDIAPFAADTPRTSSCVTPMTMGWYANKQIWNT